MRKALVAGLLLIGLSAPAMASEEKIRITHVPGAKGYETWTVTSKNNNVVVLSVRSNEKGPFSHSEITLDCPNKVMVADHMSHQNVWRADGNLWFSEKRGKRGYSSTVWKWYTFGCLGELPPNAYYL